MDARYRARGAAEAEALTPHSTGTQPFPRCLDGESALGNKHRCKLL